MDGIQVKRLEAAVQLKRLHYRTGRCSQEHLEAAERELEAAMAGRQSSPSLPGCVKPTGKERAEKPVEFSPEVIQRLTKRQKLQLEIRQMKRRRDELANALHLVPPDVNCQAQTLELVTLTRQIEGKVSIYKHGQPTPPEPAQSELMEPEELLRAKDQRKRLGEERSKLRAKLRQKGQKPHLREKWQVRASELNAILEELDERIRILRNG